MQAYEYSAVDQKGKTCSGTVSADGPNEARRTLLARQLYATDIKLAGNRVGFLTGLLPASLKRQEKIAPKELALITRQMATMIEAASPVEEVLGALAQQSEKQNVRSVLSRVRANVMEGMRLSRAMAQEPATFDSLFCAMVAAGEAAGALGPVLSRVADHREKSEETRSKIQSALIYPAVLLTVAIGVVTALMVLVVPKVVAQFESFGGELPVLTQVVVGISDFLTSYGLFLAVAIVAAIVGAIAAMRRPPIRYRVHSGLLGTPVIGRLIRSVNAARFARAFGTLVLGGSPALEALVAAKETVRSEPIKQSLADAITRVREGGGVANSLQQINALPPMLAYMAAAGERSGQLGSMMHKVADYLESEFDGFTKSALSLLEPMIVILMGGIVGVIVMSIMLPILRLNSLVLL